MFTSLWYPTCVCRTSTSLHKTSQAFVGSLCQPLQPFVEGQLCFKNLFMRMQHAPTKHLPAFLPPSPPSLSLPPFPPPLSLSLPLFLSLSSPLPPPPSFPHIHTRKWWQCMTMFPRKTLTSTSLHKLLQEANCTYQTSNWFHKPLQSITVIIQIER